jgi:hypothetical protein
VRALFLHVIIVIVIWLVVLDQSMKFFCSNGRGKNNDESNNDNIYRLEKQAEEAGSDEAEGHQENVFGVLMSSSTLGYELIHGM